MMIGIRGKALFTFTKYGVLIMKPVDDSDLDAQPTAVSPQESAPDTLSPVGVYERPARTTLSPAYVVLILIGVLITAVILYQLIF